MSMNVVSLKFVKNIMFFNNSFDKKKIIKTTLGLWISRKKRAKDFDLRHFYVHYYECFICPPTPRQIVENTSLNPI